VPARRTVCRAFILSCIGFACGLLAGAVAADPWSAEASATFLAGIGGDWQGRAVRTPAGPFGYDLRFEPDEAQCMAGIAEPGGVHHRWKFCPTADGGIELEFLSDFGGNDRAMFLLLEGVTDGTLVFHSTTLEFLKVLARLEQDCLRLQVLHDERLHVEIHLSRPAPAAGTGACPWPAPVSETL